MPEASTTPDPVELTHRAYEFLNSRDLDAVMGLVSQTCVYDMSRLEHGIYTGAEAMREFAEDRLATLHEYGVALDEVGHLGNGVVYVAQVGHRGLAPGSFIELPSYVAALWNGGLLAQVTVFADPDEARAAAEGGSRRQGVRTRTSEPVPRGAPVRLVGMLGPDMPLREVASRRAQ
jgi:hypothetical protein